MLRNGEKIIFGSGGERKEALDSTQVICLGGGAVEQILRGEVHPDFPFRGAMLEAYCGEFSREFLERYAGQPQSKKFDYVYLERMVRSVDQLAYMRENLREQVETGVLSNKCQAVTWAPNIDCEGGGATPCLQRVWVRVSGEGLVDVHMDWRSRDLYGAWQANIVALMEMLMREVLEPCGCGVRRVVDYSDSLHIYLRDVPAAMRLVRA
ncbi:MAG TPA: hypothetical protein PK659_09585 [Methanothrix sp.]|nr:hypothetical protein [Methanothrix sp.]HOL44491.1 hypothetical protein [Methanothrix sp.]